MPEGARTRTGGAIEFPPVVCEDPDFWVFDKPAGLIVESPHPEEDTLHRRLLQYQGSVDRGGLVHRLDRDTSGLLVVARSNEAQEALRRQFRERTVDKLYLALVAGTIDEDFEVEAPVGRNRAEGDRAMRIDLRGKVALTYGHPVEVIGDTTLLEVKIVTGRRHQIRTHLSYIGYPIVGDKSYGGNSELGRPFLHAARLGFDHPRTGERLHFTSELPDELQRFLDELRGR